MPFVTGAIGLLGTRPSYELMRDCDTLLIVGSNFPYSQFLPEFGQARAVQIDIDGTMIGMRYPTEVNLIGDARRTLAELIPLLTRKADRSWRETIERNVARWWQTIERQAMLAAEPVNPMRVVWELSERIPDDAIVTADPGSSTNWYARCLRLRGRARGSLSGTLATMGSAVPYAIGAKFAHPDRPVVALVGDGAMQMNGLAELLTVARYYRDWKDPRLVVCVFHNKRPQSGHLGVVRHGRSAEIRGVPDPAGCLLRRHRSLYRPGGDYRGAPRSAGRSLGPRLACRPPDAARRAL